MTSSYYDYFLYSLLGVYVFCFARLFVQKVNLTSMRWLVGAFICWPLFMLDEWLRIAQASSLAGLYGLSDVFAVIAITCCYRAIKPMLLAYPTARKRLWWPAVVTAIFQCTVLLIPIDDKQQWLSSSPNGEPLLLWPAYFASLLTGFSVLLIGILITEHIQMYHRHLPEQAVDIKNLKMPKLAGVMGSLVGVAFMSILLVTAATFGFFPVPFWESFHHLMIGCALLVVLFSLTFIRRTAPSPLNYERLDEGKATPYEISNIISKAERYTIESKAYKTRFLTLSEFCKGADIDPTSLAIALQLTEKKNFRRFIFHYRLEYAKKVLLHSDAKLEAVAKRLGVNSEKFLSEYLVKHLNAAPTK
ncbi:helix-turn-helix domain-containing protein [Alteromonas sp. PRIM-21]|uniref:helix-turn-helix domain-containing protein n=1 Tax=Alteromonas sp. PRIM-21 TaxID=1454978 RepID=UPI0022B9976D|nr:DNA mismatch repair protein [Alteromonas sp. PRIM-21]MCZ8529402.1 DNA mismatch repair protein [Alteromonas sp. PRIM-21]